MTDPVQCGRVFLSGGKTLSRRTLKKRADGYYRAWSHGKQFYGKTQKEAIQKADEYSQQLRMTISADARDILFLPFAEQRIEAYYAKAGENLRKQYHSMAKFVSEHLEHQRIVEISADELQLICNALTGYSGSHVHKFMNLIRNIFKTACANGIRLTNPMDAVRAPETSPVGGHRALKTWERDLIRNTWREHDFGPAAMVMMYAGLRRGEVLYLDVDRDVDFEARTISVRGGVAFTDGNQPVITPGKTAAAQRTIPLNDQLIEVLQDRHGLLLTKADGTMMTQSAFDCKFDSYIVFLERKLNGCPKRWYGKTREHKAMLSEGQTLPEWQSVTIRCHDFRKDFCTRNAENKVSRKALQAWMGHTGPEMIDRVYTDFTEEQANRDAEILMHMDDNDHKDESHTLHVCA